ncbi:glycosyltransferase family 2 protein [Afifella marina]|uniref:Dolichol-phosphate mannosyltransferase n=1 Tax=Afifella marina DSM 2698 TaxID=1120955 RepID=A0A1G5MP61_AFIMA|nr:glycosyltransferase family 2 protein [Afifella marina]MBK1623967.1 glycosyltransferase family 2 protein [Afifella marina DSM 2698]MBK1627117.1 glycosyltransferase family 2 protein [Afifella marina]MBK5918854.1 glycosyl transferase family 2 [Afifella marina]RAI22542.1 glycosyl transferase family 2 [Afifella marina DSM 2698]SCZ26379.1 dolichol-phosphate mannosyltransferase [Afifella marina DSM 2698]
MSDEPNSERAVPSYESYIFRDRATRYCTVIPVINEGERIVSQLTRMRELAIDQLTDIVIADGGSTDGSMETERLQALGVRALLVKNDKGKLSAQLRMGYAFALDEGYDGIVTIDGNGKDSVESIPLFVEALDDGIDYAQASRFIEGGKALNTPPIRTAAIRLVHAPLLSLAARRRFTDTTQGFRAYSRRYLEHPDVRPFRTCFDTYELLAYLTVRASQLGLKTREIPTTRSYPANEPVPTKLTAHGNADLMRILFRTLAGRYNP